MMDSIALMPDSSLEGLVRVAGRSIPLALRPNEMQVLFVLDWKSKSRILMLTKYIPIHAILTAFQGFESAILELSNPRSGSSDWESAPKPGIDSDSSPNRVHVRRGASIDYKGTQVIEM